MRHTIAIFMVLGALTFAPATAWGTPPDEPSPADDGNGPPDGRDDAGEPSPSRSFEERPSVGEFAICPVRLTTFAVEAGTFATRYRGRYYAFCCLSCKAPFEETPEQYVPAPQDQRPAGVPSWVQTLGGLDL